MYSKEKLKLNQVEWYESIDALKALGISLVVLGHTLGISKAIDHWIFSFHMPLFFFIAGFLRKSNQLLYFGSVVNHYFRRLLLPYIIFGVVTYFPWVLFTRKYGMDSNLEISIYKPLLGLIYGLGVDGWLQHNPMLWFMPTLFTLHVIFTWVICEKRRGTLLVKIIGCVALGWLLSFADFRMPWGFEIALIALPFYYFGYLLRENARRFEDYSIFFKIFLCLLFCALHYLIQSNNARVDMNAISFGVPWQFYIGGFFGIIWLYLFSIILPPIRLFGKIAQASILIYLLHRLFFSIISAVGILTFGEIMTFKLTMAGSMFYMVLSIIMGLLLFPLVKKYCPFIIGYK